MLVLSFEMRKQLATTASLSSKGYGEAFDLLIKGDKKAIELLSERDSEHTSEGDSEEHSELTSNPTGVGRPHFRASTIGCRRADAGRALPAAPSRHHVVPGLGRPSPRRLRRQAGSRLQVRSVCYMFITITYKLMIIYRLPLPFLSLHHGGNGMADDDTSLLGFFLGQTSSHADLERRPSLPLLLLVPRRRPLRRRHRFQTRDEHTIGKTLRSVSQQLGHEVERRED